MLEGLGFGKLGGGCPMGKLLVFFASSLPVMSGRSPTTCNKKHQWPE